MRPFAFILGVVAGSAVAIAVCLGMVLVVFLFLKSDHPQFAQELPVLTRFVALFAVFGGLGVASLWAQLRRKSWRWWAVVALALWSALVVVAARTWLSGER